MRSTLALIFCLPFLSFSQISDTIVHFDNMLSLPSPRLMLYQVKKHEVINDSIFIYDLKPNAASSIRILRAGFLSTHEVYNQYTDSTLTDSTRFQHDDFTPIFDSSDVRFDQLISSRKTENEPIDSGLVEYFDTYAIIKEVREDIDDVQSNYLVHIGEWIESLYMISIIAIRDKDKLLITRIANNGSSLKRIVLKLKEFNDPALKPVIDELEKLQVIFSEIKREYIHKKPTEDKESKITTINSKVKIKIRKKTVFKIKNQLYSTRSIILK